jgi:hypothetical protein
MTYNKRKWHAPLHASCLWFTKWRIGDGRFAALSTLVLVPTDVATTLEDEPATLLWLWWRIVYW